MKTEIQKQKADMHELLDKMETKLIKEVDGAIARYNKKLDCQKRRTGSHQGNH